MTTNDEASTSSSPHGGGPRVSAAEMRDFKRLRRTSRDKHIAGVAGGLARHFDVDPIIPRVALAVLVLFGGSGLLLYGALWLLVPSDDTGEAVVSLDDRSRSVAITIAGVIAGLALLGDLVNGWIPWPLLGVLLVVALLLGNHQRRSTPSAPAAPAQPGVDFNKPPAGHPDAERYEAAGQAPHYPSPHYQAPQPYVPPLKPRNPLKRGPILFWFTAALAAFGTGVLILLDAVGVSVAGSAYPALALAIVGTMLVVGAFYGRAGGLIVVGLALALATAGAVAGEQIEGEERTIAPRTAAQVQDAYDYSVGETTLVLSDVRNPEDLAGRTVSLDLGAGRVRIVLPDDVPVDVRADVGLGSIEFPDQNSGGGGIRLDGSYGASSGSNSDLDALELDVEVGLGEIVVVEP